MAESNQIDWLGQNTNYSKCPIWGIHKMSLREIRVWLWHIEMKKFYQRGGAQKVLEKGRGRKGEREQGKKGVIVGMST